jgi:hypothetical protein
VSNPNKGLVHRYYERIVDEHRLDELASFIHPEFVDHNRESSPGWLRGQSRTLAQATFNCLAGQPAL